MRWTKIWIKKQNDLDSSPGHLKCWKPSWLHHPCGLFESTVCLCRKWFIFLLPVYCKFGWCKLVAAAAALCVPLHCKLFSICPKAAMYWLIYQTCILHSSNLQTHSSSARFCPASFSDWGSGVWRAAGPTRVLQDPLPGYHHAYRTC